MTDHRPGDLPHPRRTSAARYPNVAERIIRSARDVAAIVALILVSVLMVLLLGVIAAIGHRLDQVDSTIDPAPSVTGCPFGPGECGG